MSERPSHSHWDSVYEQKQADEVSWFQTDPSVSLELIRSAGISPDEALIDVGGGASLLVDRLVQRGFTDVTVLDLAESGLAVARERLGADGLGVDWVAADVLAWSPSRRYRLWHDRAVFHFLTDAADRERYCRVLDAALGDDGHVVVGTFAADGPQQCSGLPTARYEPAELAAQFPGLRVVDQRREEHHTPWDSIQPFTWLLLVRG